jgi:membrane fusion protein (multidrug efflux system)
MTDEQNLDQQSQEHQSEPQQCQCCCHSENKSGGDSKKGDDSPDKKDEEPQKKVSVKERWKKMSAGKKITVFAIIFVLLGGFGWFAHGQYKYESTDDAYVEANATQLAPNVSALVTQVLVQENQEVKAGQILAQLDRKDFESALADAQGVVGSLEARLKDSERDYHRNQQLMKESAISKQQFDHVQANYFDLQRQLKSSLAKLDQAKLNLGFTSIKAPVDGQIARRSIDVGMYVSAGTAIFGFIPFDERWVDANYKETQLPSIALGKTAEVTVDAIPGKTFTGIVQSISPATGATFTLIPPDNATGNFTKVVQRVPVRIHLKNLTHDDFTKLQAGLSANVDLLKHSEPQALPPSPRAIFLSKDVEDADTQQAGVMDPNDPAVSTSP